MENKMQEDITNHPVYSWFIDTNLGELENVYNEIISGELDKKRLCKEGKNTSPYKLEKANILSRFSKKLKRLFKNEVGFIQRNISDLYEGSGLFGDKPNYENRNILYFLLNRAIDEIPWDAISLDLIEVLSNKFFLSDTVYELKDRTKYDKDGEYFYVKTMNGCDGEYITHCWIINKNGILNPDYLEPSFLVKREDVI
jgi:hypothetical protein